MTSHDREKTVRTLFERLSARDFDGVVALLDDNVEFDLAFAPEMLEMPVRGREAMHKLLSGIIGAMFEPFRIEISQIYGGCDNDVLVAEYKSDAVVKHNGNHYLNRYVGIFRFDGDEIVFWREYHNTEEATRALS